MAASTDDPREDADARAPRSSGGVAVVTATHGRHDQLRALHEALGRATRPPAHLVVVAFEDEALVGWDPEDGVPVTVVPMSATPEGLPWAAAKNAGATAALRRGAEVVVFVETTAELRDDTLDSLERAARQRDGVWWATPDAATPDTPDTGERDATGPEHLTSAAFAVSLGAWAELGGFHEDYVGSGFEDLDLARAAQDIGLGLGPVPGAVVGRGSPAERDDDALHRNAELHASRWGTRPAVTGGGW